MKNLKTISSEALIFETKSLVREELRIGLEVLEYLREIESRKLFLERGHSSLFSFCIRELNYSEPQAQLRIDAMRALRDTPEIEDSIKSGALNVTSVAKVQRFLRKEKLRTGKAHSAETRINLFSRVQGKSARDVDAELIKISPESALPRERERPLSDDKTELRLVIDESLRVQLEQLKSLHSHKMKDPNSTSEILAILAADALKKLTPPKSRKPDQSVAPISIKVKPPTRYISSAIKREVWTRDQSRCSFIDTKTQQRCESRRYLQIDHITPYSLGGRSDDVSNLRLYCGAHNRLAWSRIDNEPPSG